MVSDPLDADWIALADSFRFLIKSRNTHDLKRFEEVRYMFIQITTAMSVFVSHCFSTDVQSDNEINRGS